MWQRSYETEVAGVSAQQIWRVWSNVNGWHEWDEGIEYAKTEQPFQKGCRFVLKPKGGPKVQLEIIECDMGKSFTDLTTFPLAKMFGRHVVEELDNGRVLLRTTMTVVGPLGFLWRKLVAEKIADDLPKDTQKIIEIAKTL